jgi:hypothetical protein
VYRTLQGDIEPYTLNTLSAANSIYLFGTFSGLSGSVRGETYVEPSYPVWAGAPTKNLHRAITKVRANNGALDHTCVVMLLHSTSILEVRNAGHPGERHGENGIVRA